MQTIQRSTYNLFSVCDNDTGDVIMMTGMIKNGNFSIESNWKGDRDQNMSEFMAENLYD